MVLQLSVLDTFAALNLINVGIIPPAMWEFIRIGQSLDLADANNNPLCAL